MNMLATPGRRRSLFLLLYLSEGAPIGYLWWALPAQLRHQGVAVEDVTALTAALTLPWTLKFLWAPFVDIFSSPRFGLRPWIIGAQALMGITLFPLAFSDVGSSFDILAPLLIAHAFCAATQDVAIDALAVRSVPARDRGTITGWMQLGMLAGRSLFGGVALMVTPWLGSRTVVAALVVAVWSSAGVAAFADDRREGTPSRQSTGMRAARVWRLMRDVVGRRTTWLGFAFAATAGAAMDGSGALVGPLLVDFGMTQVEVGRFFALPAVLGMAAGALIGGRLSDRFDRARLAAVAIVSTAVWLGLVAAVLEVGPNPLPSTALFAMLSIAYVLFGAVTAATYATLMDLTEPDLAAVQFSAYMGAVNLCYVWSSWGAGQVAAAGGYPAAILVTALASTVSLAFLSAIRSVAAGAPSREVHELRQRDS